MENNSNHWEVVASNRRVSTTAEELWDDAITYFAWSDANPIRTKKAMVAGPLAGSKLDEETIRPYSVKALCLHCNITEEYLRDIRHSMDRDSDYYVVVSKLLYIIHVQNTELATVGIYNPNFVAKLLNMGTDEAVPQSIRVEVVHGLPALAESENEILEKLELENKLFS